MSAGDIVLALIMTPMAALCWQQLFIDRARGADIVFGTIICLFVSLAAVLSIARLCGAQA